MNKKIFKSIRDNIPEPLKYLAAPVFRNKLISNRYFNEYYNLLINRESSGFEKIKEYQLNQLKHILIYSYKNVPYYKELFDNNSFDPNQFSDFEQIKKIPYLTRKIVLENYEKLKSKDKLLNGYYQASTGGSTGSAMKFLLDYDSVFKENAFIYYYRKKIAYEFNDKTVSFRQFEYNDKLWKYNPMHNEIIFYPIKISKTTIADYVKKINDYNPFYLNGYLSSIWYFAKLINEYQLKLTIKLKGIFLASENIDINQREFIEQFFNVKSIAFYGHSERCVIAEEVLPYRYCFDPYYGYTEQILTEDNKYSIVGTGFLNYIMPFIRYKTDDICIRENEYFSIDGKRSSSAGLYGFNNEFLSSSSFSFGKELFKNITTFQFIQNEIGRADLQIVVNKHFQISELDVIKNEINRQTKGIIDINIKIVDNLVLSTRGKFQLYITNVSPD